MSSNLWDESDSEDDLPAEWDQVIYGNAIHYYNRLTGNLQKTHPITNIEKRLSSTMPYGWNSAIDAYGNCLYINLFTGQKTYTDPRLVSTFLVHNKFSKTNQKLKFDKYTSVDEILLNKDLRGMVFIVTGSGCGLGFSVALHLFKHGATVICACTHKPAEAISLDENMGVYEFKVISEMGNLFWIPCDLLRLDSVYYFIKVFKSLKWPFSGCIIVSDLLTLSESSYIVHIVNRLVCSLRNLLPITVQNYISNGLVTFSEIIKWFKRKLCPNWIALNSCDCLSLIESRNPTRDNFEPMMQFNFLAPALLIKLLTQLFEQRSSNADALCCDLRILVVSSEAHRACNVSRLNDPHMLDKLIYTQPSGLVQRLEQYAVSKLLLLTFIYEMHQRWQQNSLCHQSNRLDFLSCTGTDLFGVHCASPVQIRLACILSDPVLFVFQLGYLLTRLFGQSLNQCTATPVLYITTDNLNRLTTNKQSNLKQGKEFLYINYLRPGIFALDYLKPAESKFFSSTVYFYTENLLFGPNDAQDFSRKNFSAF